MKAIILAGGKGVRLKPYTITIPKPLVPVVDRPILEIMLTSLRKCGVQEIVMCVSHMAELLMAYFGDGSKYGLKINYSLEDIPLSTVAPIKLIKDLPENFLVMNGDLLTDLDYKSFFEFHTLKQSLLTIGSYKRTSKIDFGVLKIDEMGENAIGFQEKPEFNFDVSMGIYAFNKKVLDVIPEGIPFGFDNLMHLLISKKERISVYRHSGYWLDIGRPEDYEQANIDYQDGNL